MSKQNDGDRIVKKIKVAELIPYINNSRTHSEDQVLQIASSIRDMGFSNWRFCVENDCYVATSCGQIIRVCRRQRSRSGSIISKYESVILKGSIDKDGYRTYRMLIDGLKKHAKGHRLVINAFNGCDSSKSVNHINGNKLDNSISNIEFVTVLENNLHAIRTGLKKSKKGINKKLHQSNYVSIYYLIKYLGVKRIDIAKHNRVSRQTIDKVYNIVDGVLGNV